MPRSIKHILLVEDEAIIAMSLSDLLENQGYRTTVAYDGQLGLAAFREDPADLVVTDINMPHMNGYQLMDALQRETAAPKVAVVAGIGAGEVESESIAHGAAFVCLKPINYQGFIDNVNRVLEEA